MVSDFGSMDGDGGIFFSLEIFLWVGRWGYLEVLCLLHDCSNQMIFEVEGLYVRSIH